MSTKLIKIKLDNFNARYDDEMNMLLKKSEYFVESKITIMNLTQQLKNYL